jgi:hypothetical protein
MARLPQRLRINADVTALAAPDALLLESISPELVLVSPPEVASLARARLPTLPSWPAAALSPRAEGGARIGPLELAIVYLIVLLITLGPLLFTVLSTAHRA